MSSIGQGSISIDDSTRIGENAQDTANKVAGNVNDINNDNKLTPSEKLKLKQEYDKDSKLYAIDVSQLQSVDLPTAELETAMSNLTGFVTPLFKEMNRTSTVDRDTLDSVFTAFATADKNSSQAFVNMVQQVADDAKKAGDDAKEAGEKAQEAGEEAKASAGQAQADATQAKADAATAQQKAQSSIDQIDEALSTANLVKQNVTKLSDTTEQYHNEYTTGIQNVIKTIDDITVGGTNLIKNSSSDVVIDDTVNNQGWAHSAIYSELEAGQEYTFTSSITVNTGKADEICINVYNPESADTKLISNRTVTNGKIEYTFTAIQDYPQLLIYAGTMGGTKGNKVTFHHYQLEKGNKATDWSPAPEDLASQTQITTLNDLINQKVSNDQYQSDKTQTANLISQTVTNAVDNINVGGRNYILNSDFYITSEQKNVLSSVEPNEYSGKKITVSVDIEINNLKTIADSGHTRVGYESSFHASDNSTVYVGVWKNLTKSDIGKSFKYRATSDTYDLTEKTITSIDDGNGAFGGVYIQGITADSIKVGHPKLEIATKATDWTPAPEDLASETDITAQIGNIHLGVKNADGSTSTFNMNGNTILMDTAQTIINGKTSILDASIDTAKIANAAINTAQIADGAINNAKIANASIDDAKINSLNGNKLVENSITANKINVDDLIANGINTKTLTAVNLNASTLTTPQIDLGLNGTFTEDFDYTQATTMFLPKKNKGTLTFNHGVLQSKGTMQTYVNGQWGGMNDNITFQSGIGNDQWTELAPGYIKMDLCKQDGSIGQRIYADPTGFYYTSATGNKSYLGNILQTGQVQSGSILGKYIGPMDGQLRLQIGSNGSHYGLQVGSYAGKEAVLSDFIYSATSGASANVRITENGHLVRTTSASKYKYNIKNPDIETTLGERLLNVHLATWNDKRAVDLYAEELNTGEEREKITIDKYYGLIAEQLRDAGLDMFVDYGKNHEIEGVQYDRAWIPLLSVVRRLNDKVNEYELRLSKLEGANK